MSEKNNCWKAHVVALYLSKFDKKAYIELGCRDWNEVYKKVGNILNYPPLTIKNNRDYFDKYFPNSRQGWQKEAYKTLRDVLSEFKKHDFKNLTEIVKNILEENSYILEEDSYILEEDLYALEEDVYEIDLTHLNIELIQQETVQKEKERTLEEHMCVLALQEEEGGEREVPIFDKQLKVLVGIADLITDTEVIEVKDIKNWKHAVGQIFAYWYYLDNRDELSPRIHLFGGDGIDDYRIQLCKSLMNNIFCFDVEVIVTYSES
jgi:hypothetical protein